MGRKALELTGKRFGKLVALKRDKNDKWNQAVWRCKCDCGNITYVTSSNLNLNRIQSCGCLRKNNGVKHGLRYKTIYKIWLLMRNRCYYKKDIAYERYGGRGITICERWLNSVEAFYKDMGERPRGLTIDRINNDGNYEPGNCRWATRKEQSRNNRKAKLNPLKVKVIKNLLKVPSLMQKDIARIFNVGDATISRIANKISWDDISA